MTYPIDGTARAFGRHARRTTTETPCAWARRSYWEWRAREADKDAERVSDVHPVQSEWYRAAAGCFRVRAALSQTAEMTRRCRFRVLLALLVAVTLAAALNFN